MNTNEKEIWFPAKKYGWGWGLPCAWQGWVALALFTALHATAAVLFLPRHFGFWITSVIVLAVALSVTCFIKGERPHWRWGKD